MVFFGGRYGEMRSVPVIDWKERIDWYGEGGT